MFSAELERAPHKQNLVSRRFHGRTFWKYIGEGDCACSMELSDLLDSDTLECCEHMTDENTSEGDPSLDYCLLHTTAYRSPWKQHSATNTGARLRTYTRPPSHDYRLHPLRVRKRSQPAPPLSAWKQGYYGASQVLYGKSITSSGPIRLCDSNELCTKGFTLFLEQDWNVTW